MSYKAAGKNPIARVLSLRDFRLLFAGSATSLLGDQFALIASPWLVLKLTGDPLALGIVLALEGIPRALFMLLGGAITDRFSPRIIMLISDVIRLALTGLMAVAIFSGVIHMWMLYTFALGFGLVAGFAIPAQNSILPMLVHEDDLQAGNSLMMGISSLIGFVGPTVAGILIGSYSGTMLGIAIAFLIDAITFAFSAIFLWPIHQQREDNPHNENVLTSIKRGIKYLLDDNVLRLMFILLSAVNFLLIGPLLVGIPVLANTRLPEGAVAFGLLMSAFAGGNLIGFILAGALPRPGSFLMRIIIIAMLGSFGIVIGVLGFITSTWLDFALLLLLGFGNGYVAIILYTWMQTRTPKEMLGRMMSILLFSSTGLVPVSQAISGAVSKWNLDILFMVAGFSVVVITIISSFHPGMKAFSESLSGRE